MQDTKEEELSDVEKIKIVYVTIPESLTQKAKEMAEEAVMS